MFILSIATVRSIAMTAQRLPRIVAAAGLACCLGALPGCAFELPPELLGNGDTIPPGEGVPPDREIVRVRFANLTTQEAVDVEFFASNEPLENLPDDLLLPEHQVTASIGVAGTGIIEPGGQDVIEFPCTPNLTLGTRGGSFVDNETGEPRGAGTPRWAQQGPLALCGAVVMFRFSGDGVDFTTTLTIGD
jgi:hypothetical protein